MQKKDDQSPKRPKAKKRWYTRKAVNGKGPFSAINSESMHHHAMAFIENGGDTDPDYQRKIIEGSGLTLTPRNG